MRDRSSLSHGRAVPVGRNLNSIPTPKRDKENVHKINLNRNSILLYLLFSFKILEIVRKSSLCSGIPIFHSFKKLSIFLNEGIMYSVTFPLTAKFNAFM